LTATIRLPLAQDESQQMVPGQRASIGATAASSQIGNGTTLTGRRLIIVEDEPLLAMDLESSLIDMGCEVAGSAGTIDAARSLVAKASCDAALLDINLAGHSVDELAAALTRRKIPFAFVTGYGRAGVPKAFRDAPVLGKPFNDDQLRAVLERLLQPRPGIVQLRPAQRLS
jgi:DNA-binding LytR/AlgR family response regulator